MAMRVSLDGRRRRQPSGRQSVDVEALDERAGNDPDNGVRKITGLNKATVIVSLLRELGILVKKDPRARL